MTMGVILKINSLSIAASMLILLKLLNLETLFPKIEANSLKLGVIILTIGFLTPIAADKYSVRDIADSMKTPMGICVLIGGILVILFTGRGYGLLTSDPGAIIPIVVGTIIGMALFKGVPVGPLVASGIGVVLYEIYKLISKVFT